MTNEPRRRADLSTLDDYLETEGSLEKFQAVAIKEALACQTEQTTTEGTETDETIDPKTGE
jgi:hypothetical protein